MATMYALSDQMRHPVVPTQSEASIAREALKPFEAIAKSGVDIRIHVLGGPAEEASDVVVPLSAAAVKLIVGLLTAMADGKPFSVISSDAELTIQEAADMLNVSRPHLVELLDAERIPSFEVCTDRRVRVADLLAHRHRSLVEGDAAIAEMVAISQELGLE